MIPSRPFSTPPNLPPTRKELQPLVNPALWLNRKVCPFPISSEFFIPFQSQQNIQPPLAYQSPKASQPPRSSSSINEDNASIPYRYIRFKPLSSKPKITFVKKSSYIDLTVDIPSLDNPSLDTSSLNTPPLQCKTACDSHPSHPKIEQIEKTGQIEQTPSLLLQESEVEGREAKKAKRSGYDDKDIDSHDTLHDALHHALHHDLQGSIQKWIQEDPSSFSQILKLIAELDDQNFAWNRQHIELPYAEKEDFSCQHMTLFQLLLTRSVKLTFPSFKFLKWAIRDYAPKHTIRDIHHLISVMDQQQCDWRRFSLQSVTCLYKLKPSSARQIAQILMEVGVSCNQALVIDGKALYPFDKSLLDWREDCRIPLFPISSLLEKNVDLNQTQLRPWKYPLEAALDIVRDKPDSAIAMIWKIVAAMERQNFNSWQDLSLQPALLLCLKKKTTTEIFCHLLQKGARFHPKDRLIIEQLAQAIEQDFDWKTLPLTLILKKWQQGEPIAPIIFALMKKGAFATFFYSKWVEIIFKAWLKEREGSLDLLSFLLANPHHERQLQEVSLTPLIRGWQKGIDGAFEILTSLDGKGNFRLKSKGVAPLDLVLKDWSFGYPQADELVLLCLNNGAFNPLEEENSPSKLETSFYALAKGRSHALTVVHQLLAKGADPKRTFSNNLMPLAMVKKINTLSNKERSVLIKNIQKKGG